MNQLFTSHSLSAIKLSQKYASLLRSFLAGMLIPCGFAPIHLPGLAILGVAIFFAQLHNKTRNESLRIGFMFGLGYFGLGVSWVYMSIHDYGHLSSILSVLLTFAFIAYLAFFTALVGMFYQKLSSKDRARNNFRFWRKAEYHLDAFRFDAKNGSYFGIDPKDHMLFNCVLFSALWCLGEFCRATFLSGFPWLLLGFGQMDSPLKYLLPIIGVFGVGFITCCAATVLATSIKVARSQRYLWIIAFVTIISLPAVLKNHHWTSVSATNLSVGVIQANMSMRDKWDEALFWKLLDKYEHYVDKLIGKKQIIVMPESAIPVPINYVNDYLEVLNARAVKAGSALLLGIPRPTSVNDTNYYNSLTALGAANGTYLKQHLVPFGEFIPAVFARISNWLAIPVANMQPGGGDQSLVMVHNHAIATLICYEVAYPQLLRNQLPQAEWIVSISDDGWFGRSFAMYQQQQMSQALSLQTGRFQIVANNDGLSSIINSNGEIISSLPAYKSGVVSASIRPAYGSSPWVLIGDLPALLVSLFTILAACLRYWILERIECKKPHSILSK